MPAVLVCLLIAGLGSMSAADTLLVPKEFTTIQAAVDAAVDGDTIRVSAGVYTGTGGSVVDFGGKAIILESAVAPGDPKPVVDGEGERRCLLLENEEPLGTQIRGFQLTNGLALSGAGAFCGPFTAPVFEDCDFTDNEAITGGAMLVGVQTAVALVDCRFLRNTGNIGGGAIKLTEGAILASDCVFDDNACDQAFEDAGGAIESNGTLLLSGCWFGGIRLEYAPNNFGCSNAITQTGGGIRAVDCRFGRNDPEQPDFTGSYESRTILVCNVEPGQATFRNCSFNGWTTGFNESYLPSTMSVVSATNSEFIECFMSQYSEEATAGVLGDCTVVDSSFQQETFGVALAATSCSIEGSSMIGGNLFNDSCGFICGPDFPSVSAAATQFRNCTISGGTVSAFIQGADLLLENCELRSLRSTWASGINGGNDTCRKSSALDLSGGDSVVRDCLFHRCVTLRGGPAILVREQVSSCLIERCRFIENEVWAPLFFCSGEDPDDELIYGGAAIQVFGSLDVVDSLFQNNRGWSYSTETDDVWPLQGGAAILAGKGSTLTVSGTKICGGNGPNGIVGAFTNKGGNDFFGPCCNADFNFDGVVDGADMAELLGSWGSSCSVAVDEAFCVNGDPPGSCWIPVACRFDVTDPGPYARLSYDLNGDLVVDGEDLTILLSSWGENCAAVF
ncbi:MAG: hypothetical protein CBC35_05475 [Planctomycetes bacterium TMED75]|nr:hypothetical protein [Planctomycetaceae bacterium]OUU93559.1 MAG: hypothetical protein CBC35_05475 [Planctomycetes bacterium TMED75]